MSSDREDKTNDLLNDVYAEIWTDTTPQNRGERLQLGIMLSIAETLTQTNRRLQDIDATLQMIFGVMGK